MKTVLSIICIALLTILILTQYKLRESRSVERVLYEEVLRKDSLRRVSDSLYSKLIKDGRDKQTLIDSLTTWAADLQLRLKDKNITSTGIVELKDTITGSEHKLTFAVQESDITPLRALWINSETLLPTKVDFLSTKNLSPLESLKMPLKKKWSFYTGIGYDFNSTKVYGRVSVSRGRMLYGTSVGKGMVTADLQLRFY